MIRYLICNPREQVVGYSEIEDVLEYIDEYYGRNMDEYADEQQMDTDYLSAKNVEDFATIIGATEGICRVYEVSNIVKQIANADLSTEEEKELLQFLQSNRLEQEMDCPSSLYDLLLDMDEINLAEMISDYADEDRP